jgi:integrase
MARGRKRNREFWIGDVHQHGRKFRFKIRRGGDEQIESFETREHAESQKRIYERASLQLKGDRDIQQAMTEYERWKRDPHGGGNKPRSVDTTIDRLECFFPPEVRTLPLYRLTDAKCKELYAALKERVAVDTQRGALSCVKTFLRWCIGQEWIRTNPAEKIVGTGKRKFGEASKPQLRIDEVRRYTDVALYLCANGPGALWEKDGRSGQHGIGGPAAALAVFYLGIRANEAASLTVRDLDDGGRVVWIKDAKTEAGQRRQNVPAFLQPHFRALAKGKPSTAKLFGGQRWWIRDWVQRICDLAGAPIVCAHAMRGLHITLALREGATADAVTRAVGHEYMSFVSTTLKHYAQAGTQQNADQARVIRTIRGTEPGDAE